MLLVHRSERADVLAGALADLLSDPVGDPFQPEVVCVPAKGVERWLAQTLSASLGASPEAADGVCANVRFPSAVRLVDDIVSQVSGVARDSDPWRPDRLVWPVLDQVDRCLDEPWAGPLSVLRQRPQRRLVVARQIADLFASYAANRPRLLQAWAAGSDEDGTGRVLPPDLEWQAEFFRRVAALVGLSDPAQRLSDVCEALRTDADLIDLGPRVSVFGPTRISASQVQLLRAVSAGRDVHLWLPSPSPVLWENVRGAHGGGGALRSKDAGTRIARHPLLASLGRDARELQMVLAGTQDALHPVPDTGGPDTVLRRLQREIRDDAPADAPTPSPADDRSVQVHACHGAARQVEVLREVIVGLLADDPTLEPRDILVMCPDIEAFAPLIAATFGLAGPADAVDDPNGVDPAAEHPAHRLRVRLADRSLRQTNPVLGVLSRLLEIADGRVTASAVLDLIATAPVRRRFRFDDDDLDRLRTWVARAGVRWGLDRAHRAPFHLEAFAQNTWRAGLDRILLGAAMSEQEQDGPMWLGLALPLDDVDSSDIELAGRLAECVDRLASCVDGLGGVRPLGEWLDTMSEALSSLTDVSSADTWQVSQAQRELNELATAARGHDPQLCLDDIRALVGRRLQGRPTRANFRTGTLTVCTLVPMRAVPHRVVCLLGLDDGVFPRATVPDGDDVLARNPCVGERDPRSEDRQLLLDAVLAATEHLVITFAGADDRTNALRPPAVPLGELLDALERSSAAPGGGSLRTSIVVRHPLQPFDRRNFCAGALGRPGPFSFDRTAWHGAQVGVAERSSPTAFLPSPLPEQQAADVELESLIRFLEHPAKGLLRQRLDVAVLGSDDEPADSLSVELDALAKWAIGDRLLRDRLAGVSLDDCRQAEWRRGALPPGPLGSTLLERVLAEVEPIAAAVQRCRVQGSARDSDGDAVPEGPESFAGVGSHRRVVDVDVTLPDGRHVIGTVGDLWGETLLAASYSRLGPKHRLRAWVTLLALAAGRPDLPWRAVTIGKDRDGALLSQVGPVERDEALAALAELVSVYDEGMRCALPIPLRTGAAYAAARHRGQSAGSANAIAEREWTGSAMIPGEQMDAEHALVWGEQAPLDVLLDDPTRFARLLHQVWDPLLSRERLGPA